MEKTKKICGWVGITASLPLAALTGWSYSAGQITGTVGDIDSRVYTLGCKFEDHCSETLRTRDRLTRVEGRVDTASEIIARIEARLSRIQSGVDDIRDRLSDDHK
jgi:hypothetical protein